MFILFTFLGEGFFFFFVSLNRSPTQSLIQRPAQTRTRNATQFWYIPFPRAIDISMVTIKGKTQIQYKICILLKPDLLYKKTVTNFYTTVYYIQNEYTRIKQFCMFNFDWKKTLSTAAFA